MKKRTEPVDFRTLACKGGQNVIVGVDVVADVETEVAMVEEVDVGDDGLYDDDDGDAFPYRSRIQALSFLLIMHLSTSRHHFHCQHYCCCSVDDEEVRLSKS